MLASLTRNIFVAAALACSVTADFHLMNSDRTGGRLEYFSCPSNYYNAKCWCNGDRRSDIAFVETASNGESKATLKNICGVAALDFWWRPNGANGDGGIEWEAYIPNGDGNVVATCYSNWDGTVEQGCGIGSFQYTVLDGWVCYSYICGHA